MLHFTSARREQQLVKLATGSFALTAFCRRGVSSNENKSRRRQLRRAALPDSRHVPPCSGGFNPPRWRRKVAATKAYLPRRRTSRTLPPRGGPGRRRVKRVAKVRALSFGPPGLRGF